MSFDEQRFLGLEQRINDLESQVGEIGASSTDLFDKGQAISEIVPDSGITVLRDGHKVVIGAEQFQLLHPFRGIRSSDQTEIQIDDGYVYAGINAAYSWPQVGNADTVSSTRADGVYIIWLDITVSPVNATFTDVYIPTLTVTAEANYANVQPNDEFATGTGIKSGGVMGAGIIIGKAEVKSNKWINWEQRWFCDIYVPVFRVLVTPIAANLNADTSLVDTDTVLRSLGGDVVVVTASDANKKKINSFLGSFVPYYYAYVAGWYGDVLWQQDMA